MAVIIIIFFKCIENARSCFEVISEYGFKGIELINFVFFFFVFLGVDNYDLLNIRSRTLLKLGLHENALSEADRVVQMKPKWSKVYTRHLIV